MDSLLAVARLPKLAERAMRGAVVAALRRGRMPSSTLVHDALLRFEHAVTHAVGTRLRSALLFAERDRIARELRAFLQTRLIARLARLRADHIVALGRDAAPFDAIVRARDGRSVAVVLRRFPRDGAKLDLLRRILIAAQAYRRIPLSAVVTYDFTTGAIRTAPCRSRTRRLAA